MLYPFKFVPVFKEKIWGGDRIRKVMGLDFGDMPKCGEAWLLSGVEGSPSIVSNGPLAGNELNELLEVYMYDLVGEEVYEKHGNVFPVLIKLIDANDWLSIQVHPDDELAARRRLGNGKSEMWYVLDAGKDAQLISGFSKKTSKEEYTALLRAGALPEVLNYEKVASGDVFYMPAGRVHALGPGILLAEIQQTSDTTYRIFDWDRTDSKGNARELHIEEALDAIDFEVYDKYRTDYPHPEEKSVTLVNSPHFTTNLISLRAHALEKDYSLLDSFVALLCTKGNAAVVFEGKPHDIKAGELMLLPAIAEKVVISPIGKTELIEVHM